MYLALILLIVVGIIAAAVIGKIVKAALSLIHRNPEKEADNNDTKKSEDSKQEKKMDEKKTEVQSESEQESQQESAQTLSEEQTNRYAQARRAGITEKFWKEKSEVKIDGKVFADKCVENSNLTYLEVNNRQMAGEEFNGFNVFIEENQKMTLTYQGQALATLTRTEKTVTKKVDGKEVSETQVIFRTNTFPPKLTPGMVPDDLEKMFAARNEICQCDGNPAQVAERMRNIFSDYDNICKLKEDIDPKIQAKESKKADKKQEKQKAITPSQDLKAVHKQRL